MGGRTERWKPARLRRLAGGFFIVVLLAVIVVQSAQIIFLQKTLRTMTAEYAHLLKQKRIQTEIRDKLLLEYNAKTAIPILHEEARTAYGMQYRAPVQTIRIRPMKETGSP